MPTYAYRCQDCGNQFDIFQKFAESALTICPNCGGHIRRVIQPTGVVFKGSGFYINDSKAKPAAATSKSDTASGGDEAADKPAAKSDNGTADNGKTDKAATGSDKGTSGKESSESKPASAGKTSAPVATPD